MQTINLLDYKAYLSKMAVDTLKYVITIQKWLDQAKADSIIVRIRNRKTISTLEYFLKSFSKLHASYSVSVTYATFVMENGETTVILQDNSEFFDNPDDTLPIRIFKQLNSLI